MAIFGVSLSTSKRPPKRCIRRSTDGPGWRASERLSLGEKWSRLPFPVVAVQCRQVLLSACQGSSVRSCCASAKQFEHNAMPFAAADDTLGRHLGDWMFLTILAKPAYS